MRAWRRFWISLLLPIAAAGGCAAPTAVPLAPTVSGAGFHSASKLQEHFRKHGRDLGAASAEEYLKMAIALRDAPLGGSIVEQRRSDGVITRFDREHGTFIAFERDGAIRTFFRPNDGEAYFRRQLTRGDSR